MQLHPLPIQLLLDHEIRMILPLRPSGVRHQLDNMLQVPFVPLAQHRTERFEEPDHRVFSREADFFRVEGVADALEVGADVEEVGRVGVQDREDDTLADRDLEVCTEQHSKCISKRACR